MKEINLFHAKWCGHCVNFMPVWKKLKQNFKNLKFKEFEESDNQNVFIEKNIESFPTILFNVNNNESEYNGSRDYDVMFNILSQIDNIELKKGGGNLKRYYIKYN